MTSKSQREPDNIFVQYITVYMNCLPATQIVVLKPLIRIYTYRPSKQCS